MRPRVVIGAAALLGLVHTGGSEALELGLPLRCEPGITCWIVHHVDRDAGPGVLDHRCGRLTYDGHDAVDFAIANLRAMNDGVPVVAAAPGTVRGVRDGEPDQRIEERGADSSRGRECGNGVAITHADGFETQYCHLRRGSVSVRPGETVEAGTPLGLVGLSGNSSFPHLHFTTRRGGEVWDPFTAGPRDGQSCGGQETAGLWRSDVAASLRLPPIPITGLGLAPEVPDVEAIRAGKLDEAPLRTDAEVLLVWMQAYKLEAGDRIELTLLDPTGKVVHQRQSTQAKPQALVMSWSGPKRRGPAWMPGTWQVKASITRGAVEVEEKRAISLVAP